MATTVLGKVCITNKGIWDSEKTYEALDVVTDSGSSYIAVKSVPAGTGVSDISCWQLIASKGSKGAKGDKGDRGATGATGATGNGIAGIAKTGTSGNTDTYTITYTDGSTSVFTVTNGTTSVTVGDSVQSTVSFDSDPQEQIDRKANYDGYYQSLTSGSTEQLLSTVQIGDKVPYNFRTSGGSADIGNRLTDKIVGGTICWNQLVQNGNFANANGWSASGGTLSVANGVATFTASGGDRRFGRGVYFTKGHKYLISAQVKTATETDKICLQSANSALSGSYTVPSVDWQTIQRMYVRSGDTQNVNLGIKDMRESDWDAVQVKNIQVFDLTQMLGSVIADYVYSLGNIGGIPWFKSLFPKDYYAYNAGELLSVNVSSHDTVGFNAYDNTTGKAKLVGGMEYQITGAYTVLAYSTGETITPDADGYFTPSENGELTVTGGNATTACVHLVWDGERDGEFEEYIKHSYPLDSSLTLRGIPKLDANNKLYYDGDIYESDGTVTRKYGIVDLGTLSWTKRFNTTEEYWMFYANVNNLKQYTADTMPMIVTNTKYEVSTTRTINQGALPTSAGKIMPRATYSQIMINDMSYSTVEAFTAAISGQYMVYEFETSTTESADPFTNPQIVDDFGTEEYVDYAYSQGNRDVAVPVGHDTLYMNNLRAKLEMAPDSPDGDGDYIVRQSGGENVYVPLTKELPAAPSEDGNYVLKVTVADGNTAYAWALE